jgi:hypothetical protein
VKRPRLNVELGEREQLIISIILVILLAISVLYCLGFASLALRQAWESAPPPWDAASPQPETVGTTPAGSPLETEPSATASP